MHKQLYTSYAVNLNLSESLAVPQENAEIGETHRLGGKGGWGVVTKR